MSERIRQALEELGPVFVKLGQALSTRPDLLPADVAEELTKLQDQVPPFPAETSLGIVRQAYGEQLETIFAHMTKRHWRRPQWLKCMRRGCKKA